MAQVLVPSPPLAEAPLRLRDRLSRCGSLAAPGASAAVALAAYGATLAPTVGFLDSPELSAAALTQGVAHPTGYPLLTALGFAFSSLLPVGDPAWRLNLLSALVASLAVGLTAAVAQRLSGRRLAGWVAGGALAFLPAFWMQATLFEVYGLHLAFLAGLVLLWLRFDEEPRPGALRLLTCAAALAATHHLMIGLVLPVVALASAARARGLLSPVELGRLALCALLPLGVLAYLPVAASHGPLVNWGDPSTPGRLWLHVTGAQYRGLGPGEADLAAELWDFARECGRGFTGPGLSLAGVGLLAAARRLAPRRAAVLGAIFAGGLGFGAVHPGLDREPFFLNAFWTLAVSAGLGAGALHGWLAARRPDRARAAGLVLAAAPLLPLLAHAPEQSRRSDYRAHDRALAALAVLPPDATLLVAGPLGYPPVYASLVEELRPDVRVVDLWLRIRSDGGGYGPELEALRRSPEPGDPTLRVAAAAAGWGRPVFLEPGVRERTWERIGLARVRGGALDRLVPSSAAAPPAASHAGPLVARFEGGWLLTGARLEPDRVERGDPVRIRLAWRRIGAPPEALPKVRLLAGTPEGSLLEDGAGRPLLRHQHAWGQGWPGAARASSLAESLVLVAPRALPLGPVALFLGLEGPEGPLATEGGKAFARIGELEIAPRRRPLWTLP